MKCPFCAEDDLRDEATVCKHCGRDLGVYPSFAARIAGLEQRVSELSEALATRRFAPGDVPVGPQRHTSPLAVGAHLTLAVVAAAVGAGLLTFPLLDTVASTGIFGNPESRVLIAAAVSIVPGTLGLWIGWRFPALDRWLYFAIGTAYGAIFFATPDLRDVLSIASTGFPFTPINWDNVVYGLMTPILAVAAGGLLARAIWGTSVGTGFAQRLAKRVVGRHALGPSSAQQEDHVKRLAVALSAIAPLLTFAASLLSAYLGFLAKK